MKMIFKLCGLMYNAYAFLATTLVLTQIVILFAFLGRGFLTNEKIDRLQAVYTDVDYQQIRLDLIQAQLVAAQDQDKLASTEVILARRVSINRLADDVALSELRLREAGRRFELVEETFTSQVEKLEKDILDATRKQLQSLLKNMDSAQLKASLVGIVQDGGMDDVVAVLENMSNNEQSKVFSEFQSEEEKKMLAEILTTIRN